MSPTITGPSFIALQVRDVAAAADFYETALGLTRAPASPPGAVVFTTEPIAFAVREPAPGVDLEAGPLGLGVALWLAVDDTAALHARLVAGGVEIVTPPFDGPFGSTLELRDRDGYLVTVHEQTPR